MKMRLMLGGIVTAAMATAVAAVGCGGATISLGDDAKALLSSDEIKPVTSECTSGTQRPNVCCQGTKCYAWIDDPFRPCEFGYESIVDGSKCCSPTTPGSCTPTPPPAPPEPCSDPGSGCVPPPTSDCTPATPQNCPPPVADICSPNNPTACNVQPGEPDASCITIDGLYGAPRLVRVDINTGAVTKLMEIQDPELYDVSSLGVVKETNEVFFCTRDGSGKTSLGRVVIGGSGKVERTPTPSQMGCEGATSDTKNIILGSFDGIRAYASIGHVTANAPFVTMAPAHASRFGQGEDGSEILAAWHSDSKITRLAFPPTSNPTKLSEDIKLEGYDGWIFGVSGAIGARLVVASPSGLGGSGTLHVFTRNGKFIRKVGHPSPSSLGFQGLACTIK